MDRPFKWGIIGLGKIAGKFAEDLGTLPDAELFAVASRSIEKAKEFGNRFNAKYHYGSYQELMTNKEIDAVYIATPHAYHFENTIMCLEHKIPVLCEKPLAINSQQVIQMVNAAKANDTFLMEAIWTRFLPTITQVLKWIEQGTIGEIKMIKADFGFKATFDPASRLFNTDLGGGSLLDIGIYPCFLALLLLGKPEQIIASANIGQTQVDESCGFLFKYPQQLAILDSTIKAQTDTVALIYGDKGSIKINSRWHEPTSLTLKIEGEDPRDLFFDYKSKGYSYEAIEVMKCVREGKKESSTLPLSFSVDLMETLDSIRSKAGIYYPKYDNFAPGVKSDEEIKFSKN